MKKFLTPSQKSQIAIYKNLKNEVKCSRKEQMEIHEKVLAAVVKDSCTFNVFTKDGMREFIRYLKPGYQPPNRKTIARLLKKK